MPPLSPDEIAAMFTRPDGSYLCARWGRPVAPVAFGLADETLAILRAALGAVFADAGHPLAETDPEMGANLMIFAARDWEELRGIPDLDRLTGTSDLPGRLMREGAEEYMLFRFDPSGAIRACLVFLRFSGALAHAHPARLAEQVAVNAALTFARRITPDARTPRLIRAAYAPEMPAVARDPSHALRVAARV